jgi:hypothetical protein
MAVIRRVAPPRPLRVERFLGLNEDTTGDTQLQVGESPDMTNFRLSENYKLKKREGYKQLFSSLGSVSVRGMWFGRLNASDEFLFNVNQKVWREEEISGTDYNSLDTSYSNVDVIKTTALTTPLAGTTGIDGYTIYNDKSDNTLVEVAQADIDNVSNVGKYYYNTDKTIWIIVAKGTYADIAAARTGLGTTIAYIAINYDTSVTPAVYRTIADADMYFYSFEDTVTNFGTPETYPNGGERTYLRETKVYMLNGNEYYSWDGTTFEVVKGYIPLIRIGTPNTGGGTAFEVINTLTGSKRQQFNGLASSNTVYQLAETNVDTIDHVYVNGKSVKASTTTTTTGQYAGNTVAGTVTLNGNVFPAGTNNVEIYWTKDAATRSEIVSNKYAMLFGGKNDTRVFLYGSGTNRYYYSDLGEGNTFSADYFPATFYQEVGSPKYEITGIIRQYDRQIIFTNDATYYSYYNTTLINDLEVPDFPTFPLNEVKGHLGLGQIRLIQNNPYSVWVGVQEWIATNVRDERNANYISKRVQSTLDSKDLETVITEDWEQNYEYWMAFENEVIIHNYRLNVWYKFELDHNVTKLYVREGNMYFGTDDGRIMKFNADLKSDNGANIDAHWESGFYDFEAEYLQKFIDEMWISLQPSVNTSVDITYETDRDASSQTYDAEIKLFTFEDVDFANFTFLTSVVPQPFRFKIKAKKFVYFKLKLDNNANNEKLTVLSINLAYNYGSKSK